MNDLEKLCARTACKKPGADWWSVSNRAWYCQECADLINEHNRGWVCISQADIEAIWNQRSPTAQIVEELRGIVSELAAWSKRWPKQVIYSVTRQQKYKAELSVIEAKAIALTEKHSLPEPKGVPK